MYVKSAFAGYTHNIMYYYYTILIRKWIYNRLELSSTFLTAGNIQILPIIVFLRIISWLESVEHTKNQVWRYWQNLFESVTVDYSNKLRRGVKVNMQIFYLNSISQFEANFRSHCCSPNILQRRLLSQGCGSGSDIDARRIRLVCNPVSKQKDGYNISVSGPILRLADSVYDAAYLLLSHNKTYFLWI